MEIPVFDIKGSDASAAAPFKQADSTGKITVANFTKIFDGCVNDCSNPEQGSGVKAAVIGQSEDSSASAELLTFNAATVKAAVDIEGSTKTSVISENGAAAKSAGPLTSNTTSEKPAVADEAATQDLFRRDESTIKALAWDFTASTYEAAEPSKGSTNASAVAEQTLVAAPFQSAPLKNEKSEKSAKQESAVTLKNIEKQSSDSTDPVLTSQDKPSGKTEIKEAQNAYPAKELTSSGEGVKKSVSIKTEKSEEKVPSPAHFSPQSQPVPVAVVQEVNKQASVVMPASQGRVGLNTGTEKAPERPFISSEEKASKASGTAPIGAGTLSTANADSVPASEEVLAASVKVEDIKSAKALSDTDREEPNTDNMTPKGLNAGGADHGDKNILKADANGPVTKKAQTVPSVFTPENYSHSDAAASAENAAGKSALVKGELEHLPTAFAERLRAENPGSNASNGQAGAEKQADPLFVNAASGSEGFEDADERGGKGGEGKKEGLLRVENATGTLHAGPEVKNLRLAPDAAPAKLTETVRAEAVFEKLDFGVKWSLGKGGKEVSLSLSPEHLGQLHIKLNIEESTVKARIVVESDAAKAILETDSGKLKEVFARQGLTLDKYTIELSHDSNLSGGGNFTENGARENMFDRPSSLGRAGGRDEETAGTKAYVHPENIRRSTGGIDLFA